MTDIDLCQWIDTFLVPRILKNPENKTIYDVPCTQRIQLYERLSRELKQQRYEKGSSLFNGKYVTDAQLQRCLCLPYPK